MDNDINKHLALGISLLVIGTLIGNYSLSIYLEVKQLYEQVNFSIVDYNNNMSTAEKYNKYLSYADIINQKLTKKKDLLIKNASCIYPEFATHNTLELYALTKKMDFDESKIGVVTANVRELYSMLKYYSRCENAQQNKAALENILNEIQQNETNKLNNEQRINEMINDYRNQQKKRFQENSAAIEPGSSNNKNFDQEVQSEQLEPIQTPSEEQPTQQ